MARNKTSVEEKYNAPFPTALRALMEERGETQENIAKAAEKTRQTVSQYVNGISEPSYETLVKIADYFNVSADYLLGRTEDPNRKPCAADELGLSSQSITTIKNFACVNVFNDAMEGMDLLITRGGFLPFASRINNFCKAVSKNIDLANVYDLLAADDEDPRFKRVTDEIVAEQAFKDAFLSNHPEYKDHFDIRVGARYIATFRRDLEDEFQELLRKISNYNEFVASQYEGSV